jgi:hypothetical protein
MLLLLLVISWPAPGSLEIIWFCVSQDGEKLVLKRLEETKVASAMHGLSRCVLLCSRFSDSNVHHAVAATRPAAAMAFTQLRSKPAAVVLLVCGHLLACSSSGSTVLSHCAPPHWCLDQAFAYCKCRRQQSCQTPGCLFEAQPWLSDSACCSRSDGAL